MIWKVKIFSYFSLFLSIVLNIQEHSEFLILSIKCWSIKMSSLHYILIDLQNWLLFECILYECTTFIHSFIYFSFSLDLKTPGWNTETVLSNKKQQNLEHEFCDPYAHKRISLKVKRSCQQLFLCIQYWYFS